MASGSQKGRGPLTAYFACERAPSVAEVQVTLPGSPSGYVTHTTAAAKDFHHGWRNLTTLPRFCQCLCPTGSVCMWL